MRVVVSLSKKRERESENRGGSELFVWTSRHGDASRDGARDWRRVEESTLAFTAAIAITLLCAIDTVCCCYCLGEPVPPLLLLHSILLMRDDAVAFIRFHSSCNFLSLSFHQQQDSKKQDCTNTHTTRYHTLFTHYTSTVHLSPSNLPIPTLSRSVPLFHRLNFDGRTAAPSTHQY